MVNRIGKFAVSGLGIRTLGRRRETFAAIADIGAPLIIILFGIQTIDKLFRNTKRVYITLGIILLLYIMGGGCSVISVTVLIIIFFYCSKMCSQDE